MRSSRNAIVKVELNQPKPIAKNTVNTGKKNNRKHYLFFWGGVVHIIYIYIYNTNKTTAFCFQIPDCTPPRIQLWYAQYPTCPSSFQLNVLGTNQQPSPKIEQRPRVDQSRYISKPVINTKLQVWFGNMMITSKAEWLALGYTHMDSGIFWFLHPGCDVRPPSQLSSTCLRREAALATTPHRTSSWRSGVVPCPEKRVKGSFGHHRLVALPKPPCREHLEHNGPGSENNACTWLELCHASKRLLYCCHLEIWGIENPLSTSIC